MALTAEELRAILEQGHETPATEFKVAGDRSNREYFARVIRAVLALANRRGGGHVVIGANDDGGRLTVAGLSAEQLRTWGPDAVVGAIAAYADPFVTVSVQRVEVDAQVLVVLQVDEFESVPVICKRDFEGILRSGACYVRRRGRVESSEVPNHGEMRELMDLATEKGVRSFLQTAGRVGLVTREAQPQPADDDLFRRQAEREL